MVLGFCSIDISLTGSNVKCSCVSLKEEFLGHVTKHFLPQGSILGSSSSKLWENIR